MNFVYSFLWWNGVHCHWVCCEFVCTMTVMLVYHDDWVIHTLAQDQLKNFRLCFGNGCALIFSIAIPQLCTVKRENVLLWITVMSTFLVNVHGTGQFRWFASPRNALVQFQTFQFCDLLPEIVPHPRFTSNWFCFIHSKLGKVSELKVILILVYVYLSMDERKCTGSSSHSNMLGILCRIK